MSDDHNAAEHDAPRPDPAAGDGPTFADIEAFFERLIATRDVEIAHLAAQLAEKDEQLRRRDEALTRALDVLAAG